MKAYCPLLRLSFIPPLILIPFTDRDHVDLDARVARQTRGLNGRARRPVLAERARVNLVHRGEIIHVGQIDGRLHHVFKSRPGRLQHFRQVKQDLFGLFRDPARDELSGRRIERNLARGEDVIPHHACEEGPMACGPALSDICFRSSHPFFVCREQLWF